MQILIIFANINDLNNYLGFVESYLFSTFFNTRILFLCLNFKIIFKLRHKHVLVKCLIDPILIFTINEF